VGCRFNCAFCASGKAGFIRNLEAGEIIEQVIAAARIMNGKPSNIVFMGIGEPFDNYDNVIRAANILNDADGLKIGARKITVSTSGVIPGIRRFATENKQFELSVSLHAPDNEVRSQIMPINKKYPLSELMKACREYTSATNRIITFEYTLIGSLNDTPQHARELVALLRRLPSRVNLIPLSPVDGFAARPSSPEATRSFMDILQQARINVTLRDSKGSSISAACGQLRFS
jgi:23S rRNA (adenine2503-C2)-methyltransferase